MDSSLHPEADVTSTSSSRFRFKAKRKREHDDDDDEPRRRHSRTTDPWHHHSSGSSRRREHAQPHRPRQPRPPRPPRTPAEMPTEDPLDGPTFYHYANFAEPQFEEYFDPDAAFRESLFDALADDEGAAFWEGVYGQPIHTYGTPLRPGPLGELEQMTDEEYAAYVRAQMYKTTHEHIAEERARRQEERRRQARANRHSVPSDRDFARELEASLRRGEERRRQARWTTAWTKYQQKWETFLAQARTSPRHRMSSRIPWPVESHKMRDVEAGRIEDFFRNAPAETRLVQLKQERIRWHPDKMQQRMQGMMERAGEGSGEAGGAGVRQGAGGAKGAEGAGSEGEADDELTGKRRKRNRGGEEDEEVQKVMRTVTAVFQVIDRLWNEERART